MCVCVLFVFLPSNFSARFNIKQTNSGAKMFMTDSSTNGNSLLSTFELAIFIDFVCLWQAVCIESEPENLFCLNLMQKARL